jgi:hypothetical protein
MVPSQARAKRAAAGGSPDASAPHHCPGSAGIQAIRRPLQTRPCSVVMRPSRHLRLAPAAPDLASQRSDHEPVRLALGPDARGDRPRCRSGPDRGRRAGTSSTRMARGCGPTVIDTAAASRPRTVTNEIAVLPGSRSPAAGIISRSPLATDRPHRSRCESTARRSTRWDISSGGRAGPAGSGTSLRRRSRSRRRTRRGR